MLTVAPKSPLDFSYTGKSQGISLASQVIKSTFMFRMGERQSYLFAHRYLSSALSAALSAAWKHKRSMIITQIKK